MALSSSGFVLFFFVVVTGTLLTRRPSARAWWLLVASYAFILSAGVASAILVAITSSVDYQVGKRLATTNEPALRKRWCLLSVVTNLGVLGGFKYASALVAGVGITMSGDGSVASAEVAGLILPVGISYFTFTGISYVLDVYYERTEACHDFGAYCLYVAFFPKFLAGPLARASELLSQVHSGARPSAGDVEAGAARFLVGALKKVVIADQLADHVQLIFSAPGEYSGATLLQGLVGYTVQIYCDFSGYSDMAIGCARILGFRMPENFDMPYCSINITEFWRRWHITLSGWFRDYVFLPLEIAGRDVGGAALRTSMSLMATMTLCGLWHGAGWTFIVWGGFHGASLAIHRVWRVRHPLRKDAPIRIVRILASRILTLAVVMLAWIFFRADSLAIAIAYLSGLLTWQDGLALGSSYIVPLSVLVIAGHVAFSRARDLTNSFPAWPIAARVGAYSALLLWLSLMAAADSAPFVYTQF